MGFTPYSLSRGAPSATRPPLRTGQDNPIFHLGGRAGEGDSRAMESRAAPTSRAKEAQSGTNQQLRPPPERGGDGCGLRSEDAGALAPMLRTARGVRLHLAESGGEGGIRTLEGLAPLAVFKTAAFNRSATSPRNEIEHLIEYYGSLSSNKSGAYPTAGPKDQRICSPDFTAVLKVHTDVREPVPRTQEEAARRTPRPGSLAGVRVGYRDGKARR